MRTVSAAPQTASKRRTFPAADCSVSPFVDVTKAALDSNMTMYRLLPPIEPFVDKDGSDMRCRRCLRRDALRTSGP